MEYDELTKLIDVSSGADIAYFEQYAELVEYEDYISPEALTQFFDEAAGDTIAELNDTYFEDLLENIPDTETDLYTLLSTIGRELSGLARIPEHDEATEMFADEFYRFRTWYTSESEVRCTAVENGEGRLLPLIQALALYRSGHFSDEEYTYDFSGALDYQVSEYAMTLELLDNEDADEPYDDIDED